MTKNTAVVRTHSGLQHSWNMALTMQAVLLLVAVVALGVNAYPGFNHDVPYSPKDHWRTKTDDWRFQQAPSHRWNHHQPGGFKPRIPTRWTRFYISTWVIPKCDWSCGHNCRKVRDEYGHYKCDCKPLCTNPDCGPGCEVEKVFVGDCPGCICKEETATDIDVQPTDMDCVPPTCDTGCFIEEQYDGLCPVCQCPIDINTDDTPTDTTCVPPTCDLGCFIEEGDDDSCPYCKCTDINVGDKNSEIECPPVDCAPGCVVEEKYDGTCPGCKCKDIDAAPTDIDCVPPTCAAGCFLEENNFPCPECKCVDINVGEKGLELRCPIPDCAPGCVVEEEYDGACPECKCKEEERVLLGSTCDLPICPPGCSIQKVFEGPCPGCDCEEDEEGEEPDITCDPPKCPDDCVIQTRFRGSCPGCDCFGVGLLRPRSPMCSPLKCEPGCSAQQESDDLCPKCECPKEETKDVPRCPPSTGFRITMVCDRNCKKVKDENGCESCNCHPSKCPRIHCPMWCSIKEVEDACPLCDCPERKNIWKPYNV